jgi:hypothetical protein
MNPPQSRYIYGRISPDIDSSTGNRWLKSVSFWLTLPTRMKEVFYMRNEGEANRNGPFV